MKTTSAIVYKDGIYTETENILIDFDNDEEYEWSNFLKMNGYESDPIFTFGNTSEISIIIHSANEHHHNVTPKFKFLIELTIMDSCQNILTDIKGFTMFMAEWKPTFEMIKLNETPPSFIHDPSDRSYSTHIATNRIVSLSYSRMAKDDSITIHLDNGEIIRSTDGCSIVLGNLKIGL